MEGDNDPILGMESGGRTDQFQHADDLMEGMSCDNPTNLSVLPVQEKVYMNDRHSWHVMKVLSQLRQEDKLCDAEIQNGTTTIKAHKVVLSAACPALLSLYKDIPPQNTIMVKLPSDIHSDAISAFLVYIYDGMLRLTVDTLSQMKMLAELMKEDTVLDYCKDFESSSVHMPVNKEELHESDLGLPIEQRADDSSSSKTCMVMLGLKELKDDEASHSIKLPMPSVKAPEKRYSQISAAPSEPFNGPMFRFTVPTKPFKGPIQTYAAPRLPTQLARVPAPLPSASGQAPGASTRRSTVPKTPTRIVVVLPITLAEEPKTSELEQCPANVHVPTHSSVSSPATSNMIRPICNQPSEKGLLPPTPQTERTATEEPWDYRIFRRNLSASREQSKRLPWKSVHDTFFCDRHCLRYDYKCKNCSVQLFTEPHAVQHIQALHQTDPKDAIEEHVIAELKSDPSIIKCGVCDHNLRRKASRNMHYHRYFKHQIPLPAERKLLRCEVCNKEFNRPMNFREHMNTHKDTASCVCEFCGRAFAKLTSLTQHVYQCHNEEKRYVCKECGKGYKSRGDVEIHIRTHTGVRPFKCPQCSYQAIIKGNLKMHMWKCHKLSIDQADIPALEDIRTMANSVKPVDGMFEVLPSSKDKG